MDVVRLIDAIRETPTCRIFPASGLPMTNPNHVLADDVRDFYLHCGGVSLFEQSQYPVVIVPPERLRLANPILLGSVSDEELAGDQEDISWSWYTIADTGNGNFITIDLSPERLGRCYDSFWDSHGVAGSCRIVATSFTDLLSRLFANGGQYWYWLRPDFESLGDAYD